MSKRSHLLESISETITDYREGEISTPTPTHVDRWVKQFDKPVQRDILFEMDHILKQTYWSKERVIEDLTGMIETKELAGKNPASFWKSANFLNIQQLGNSQEDFMNLLDDILKRIYDFNINECGSPEGPYIYIDDCLFTGGHIIGDLKRWIDDNGVNDAELHIIVIGCHRLGEYFVKKDLVPLLNEKNVNVKLWRSETIEDRKFNINQSQVLRPTTIPNEPHVIEYVRKLEELDRKPLLRKPMKDAIAPFSSEGRRQVLEEAFLIAGAYIIDQCQNPAVSMRPLGYWNIHALGFGSLFITYRNCPNNCPLALWWGDPNASLSHPFSKWYPLVPRKVNRSDEIGNFELNWDIFLDS